VNQAINILRCLEYQAKPGNSGRTDERSQKRHRSRYPLPCEEGQRFVGLEKQDCRRLQTFFDYPPSDGIESGIDFAVKRLF